MKTIHYSIILSCCIFLSYATVHVANATVPMYQITIAGGANTPNCSPCLVPQNITVSKGVAIEWINKDLVPHEITSGRPGDLDNGTIFDSGTILAGKSFIQNFNDVGIFPYFDKKYTWGAGTITVTDSTVPTQELGTTSNATSQICHKTIPPHNWPSSHIYVTDAR